MHIEIDLVYGSEHRHDLCEQDVQENIDALRRVMDNKSKCSDFALLLDTISILEEIKRKVKNAATTPD